jgi:hypothetical protein
MVTNPCATVHLSSIAAFRLLAPEIVRAAATAVAPSSCRQQGREGGPVCAKYLIS